MMGGGIQKAVATAESRRQIRGEYADVMDYFQMVHHVGFLRFRRLPWDFRPLCGGQLKACLNGAAGGCQGLG
ncbi:hypothetical protein AYO44_00995 [Planctomycetaceae bacterium SCGC AG-212-F19]|nr:hypothetical protein AYO44_00995 [Planctomycetaceae bacterium SCGC AG-212-F19]